ncbi:uncharacterized protein LOC128638596 isoform X2 [Bombina bombina]|uniref:uncharacterized protein LOC128638596 isoform X2 n=1 Tax=Bombina bombina TaxID=8345 RepID=UPI00235ACAAD|nr:uncharacterized protein LOC128638596 isoform X2 [Bombina bombina]
MEAISEAEVDDSSPHISFGNAFMSSCQSPQGTENYTIAPLDFGIEQEIGSEKQTSKRKLNRALKKRNERSGKIAGQLCIYQVQDESELQSGIGDLVLAAELMEKASEITHHHLDDMSQTILHDHGEYCLPDEPELLKQMVKELKKTTYQQNQLLISLQETLEFKEKQYQELQEKWENEKWTLLTEMGQQISNLESNVRNLHCEKEILEKKNKDLQEQLIKSSGTVLYLGQQVKDRSSDREEGSFCMNSIKSESKWVRFYTGFEGYEQLKNFLSFVTADQNLCAGKIRKRTEVGPQSALSLEDQLLLVLTRLRLGLLLQDLAFRFRVSESTVSRYWLNWTDLLHVRLTQIPILYSSRYLELFEPKRTVQHLGLACTIMDCTDLFFEVQAKDRTKPASSHPCRNHYLRRGYAIASSNGFITFSSSLPFGIATKVMDGQPQEELTGGMCLPLELPPFMQNVPVQLTQQQQDMSRRVLSLLSLIDKALNFRFLKGVYPQSMEAQVDRAWTICCYLSCLLHDPMGLS